VLKGVSRAFYLSLRVLPKGLREPMGLAYLLGRAADTIADTTALPPSERMEHLLCFRQQVRGDGDPTALEAMAVALAGQQPRESERLLLESLGQAFGLLGEMTEDDARRVRIVVDTLTRGMEFDLSTFPSEESGDLAALKTDEALDSYTYLVAGCVGEFWTDFTIEYTDALAHWDRDEMAALGVRFGKALQFTNVLRDVPADLRIGRCYLPESRLADVGLAPSDLLAPGKAEQARPVLVAGIRAALGHFTAAEEYLLAIPRRCFRLRLAAAWPILIGLGTLEALAKNAAWLDPTRPSKVTRPWVYRMVGLSLLAIGSNRFMRAWIVRLMAKVELAL
jgi:farnesyl-diphosphate farnesyltransferase